MKDKLLLIVSALILAGLAGLFWQTTRQWGFLILAIISYGTLFWDNIRLRRQIRKLTKIKQ